VNDTLGVEIFESRTQLVDKISRLVLRVPPMLLLLQIFVELSSWGIFEDQVYFFVVPEEPIHTQNIAVSQVRLNLNFTAKLVLNIRFLQLLLVQNLQCHNELRFFFPSEVDMSKLASAEWFANFKIVNGPVYMFEFRLGLPICSL
jgi:hypothetical protein